MRPLRFVVLGTIASNPYAGHAWPALSLTVGLSRLGHDAYYFETTSSWPYDPLARSKVASSDYAVSYLARAARRFGLDGRWAYRRSYSDKAWLGLERAKAEELLAHADAVFNITGATPLAEEGLEVGRLVYYGTDPGYHEAAFAAGDAQTRAILGEHDDVVTVGENLGTERSPLPPLPRLRARTRQPVLLDLWRAGPPARDVFTTVGNWSQHGRDLVFGGETYFWSKDREFLKFVDLPGRVRPALELATNLADARGEAAEGEPVPADAVPVETRRLLLARGWRLVDAPSFTLDPWPYRDYIRRSRGEFTVAKDVNVRLQTGWFSERSAYYLAAGRPVVTQDTGFAAALPTGTGLFPFTTLDEAAAAIEKIERDYERHSRGARAVAEECFRAETVLASLLQDLGL
jgi:hypothetical protein